jgi:hypothetical protein
MKTYPLSFMASLVFFLMTPFIIHAGEPFESSRLFTVRYIKHTTKTERFSFGLDFSISPVKAIAKATIDNIKQQYPESAIFIDLAQSIDLTPVKAMSTDELKATLLAIPGLTEEERSAIQNLTDNDKKAIDLLVDAVSDKEKATTFSMEPFFELNLDVLSLRLGVPLAGFYLSKDFDFSLGNIYLDTKFSYVFNKSVPLALLYGLSIYTPTGGKRSVAIGLGYGLAGTKYYYQYLTFTPYLGFGVDLKWVIIELHAEFSQMIKVRGAARSKFMSYMGYGLGIVIVPIKYINIDIEMAGAVNFKNAAPFGSHYILGGLRANFFGVQIGVAVQAPFLTSKAEAFGNLGGLTFGSPAKINVLVTAGYSY